MQKEVKCWPASFRDLSSLLQRQMTSADIRSQLQVESSTMSTKVVDALHHSFVVVETRMT